MRKDEYNSIRLAIYDKEAAHEITVEERASLMQYLEETKAKEELTEDDMKKFFKQLEDQFPDLEDDIEKFVDKIKKQAESAEKEDEEKEEEDKDAEDAADAEEQEAEDDDDTEVSEAAIDLLLRIRGLDK